MDSDIHNHFHNNNINSNNNNNNQQQQQQQQQNMNSGLTRYRSAPNAYFSNLITSGVYKDEDLDLFFNARVSSPETERILSRFISGDGDNNRNLDEFQQQQMMYQNQTQPQEVVHNNNTAVFVDRLVMDTSTNLVRQSSSPAGFLEHINMDNGYSMMRSVHQFQHGKGPMTRNNGGYWDESSSSMLNDRFLEEFGESDQISSSKNQEKMDEGRIRSVHAPTSLTHQLSLPTSSTELSVKEKLMQFQDNVPLRSRAKRGCATHPRSIAERVRRTRISERMRKLQDLVPNMDKQTSTADMLDLAVDYIKELQNQVETLSDRRTKCRCLMSK